jgi:hypothetical protein
MPKIEMHFELLERLGSVVTSADSPHPGPSAVIAALPEGKRTCAGGAA